MRKLIVAAALALAPLCAADTASAQAYPSRSVQVIVPFAGGSASDVITRVLLERMGTSMGRRFIVENRPGAGGNTGTAAAAKAEPDGYTLVMSTLGPLAANKTLFRELGYDPENDFAPISLFANIPNVIVVSAKLPVRSLKRVHRLRQEPAQGDQLWFGRTRQFAASRRRLFRAGDRNCNDACAVSQHRAVRSRPHCGFGAGGLPVPSQRRTGRCAPATRVRLRSRARSGWRRCPDVPTVAEAGITGYAPSGWLALLAPRGTPKPIIAKLHEELAAAIADPAVRDKFSELGAEAVASTPEELARFISSEIAKWRGIITKAGITVTE